MRLMRNLLRGWALALGVFALVNWLVAWRDGGVDPNLWWIDLRWAPFPVGKVLALVGGLALIFVGVCPPRALKPTARWTRPVFIALFAVSAANGIAVLRVFHQGHARGSGIPLSFVVALLFLGLHELVRRSPDVARQTAAKDHMGVAAGVLSFGLLFPLSLVWTFGSTNYASELVMAKQRGGRGSGVATQPEEQPETRRPLATAKGATAVVFGAGVKSNGEPSLALYDRARTAIDLYKDGVVERLYFSGGPGPDGQHEVAAMVNMAIAEGLPEDVLVLDRFGLSSAATAAHAVRDLDGKVFAVSHGYHLPRIELAFWEQGIDVRTVPAKETQPLARRHFYTLREVPGFWAYWAKRGINAVLAG